MSQITLVGAEWCKPCEYLKANIVAWAASVKCELPIEYQEYDSEKHCVDKLPTLIYTYDGLEKARVLGTDETQIRVFLMNAVAYGEFLTYGYDD